MRNLLTTTTLAALLALGGTAFAQATGGQAQGGAQSGQAQSGANPGQAQAGGEGSTRRSTDSNTMQSGALNTQEQVRGKLAAEGFTDIQAITRSGNSYQARAMQNGRAVDLTIDATTGTIRSQAAAR